MLFGEKGLYAKELLDLLDLREWVSDHLLAVDDVDLVPGEHLGTGIVMGYLNYPEYN